MLNIKKKTAVIVGGGQIAYRKVVSLLQARACVTVISPEIDLQLEKLSATKQLVWKKKTFEPNDLDSALIVIAATNSKQVNAFVAASANKYQLVNVIDNQEIGNFHVPAKLTRGDLTINVATGGASPVLAKVIRDELADIYDESYKDYLTFLAIAREKINHSFLQQKVKLQLLKRITKESYRHSKEKQKGFLEMIDGLANKEKSTTRYDDSKLNGRSSSFEAF